MFILKDYIKKGFLEAIGKMGDYQIILNSAGWFEKGVLTEEDLAEIQSAIDDQYPQVETETEETVEGELGETDSEIVEDSVIADEENTESETVAEENTETEVIS